MNNRRALLKLIGGSAVLLPLVGLSACGRKDPAAAATPAPTPEPAPVPVPAPEAAASAVPAAAPLTAASGELPHQDENDPMAKALGYHQDSAQVDATKYPKHDAGQACKHCVQFKGTATDAWGGCNIFQGKQVNANGWCSAFAAKA